jgi:CubicO group peptidase (beta-lactamase class C family)
MSTLEFPSGNPHISVQWNEDYEDRNSDAWWLVHEFADDRADLVAHMAAKHRAAPAGTVFNYNTGETNLAGILVARATGIPISRYLSEKIWSKAGMESDAYWLTTGGTEVGGCCISIRLRDYARFGLFFMHGAKVDGRSILPTHWIRDATTRHTEKVFDHFGYGYFWWVRSDRSYEAIGIYGQSIFLDPASDLVVVTLSAWPRADWQEGYARQAAFLDAVQAGLRR